VASPKDDRHISEEIEDVAATEGNWLAKQIIARQKLPLHFYIEAGLFEGEFWGGPAGISGILGQVPLAGLPPARTPTSLAAASGEISNGWRFARGRRMSAAPARAVAGGPRESDAGRT